MTTIDENYFKTFKKFRLEWQPGPEGYVHWYIDGIYRFGIEASSLTPWDTKIPDEPSYVIINTGVYYQPTQFSLYLYSYYVHIQNAFIITLLTIDSRYHLQAMHQHQLVFAAPATVFITHSLTLPLTPILLPAISTSWGFPNPPWGCTEYDCKTTEGQCGMNSGFCKTLPAKYLIDSVRVYQKKGDKQQSIGCNPRDRPTKKWIMGHEYRYKNR